MAGRRTCCRATRITENPGSEGERRGIDEESGELVRKVGVLLYIPVQVPGECFSYKTGLLTSKIIPTLYENISLGTCTTVTAYEHKVYAALAHLAIILTCLLMEPMGSTKDEGNKSAIPVSSRRKGGRWRNGALVCYLSLAKGRPGDISLRLANNNRTLPKLNEL